MIDTLNLERKIAESGKKKGYLAAKIGCTVQSFRLKCDNKFEFKLSEVEILCNELNITRPEKEKIFFKK